MGGSPKPGPPSTVAPIVTPSAPSLLLLIPAYNEERRIGPVLAAYAEHFIRHYPGRFQMVVVLNGCRDRTLDVVREAEKRYLCIAHLDFPAPIGKGGALIEGLKLAPLADLVGYVDADGATPPESFLDLVRRCGAGEADCVIASRWTDGSRINVAQTKDRRIASRLFHGFVEALFWMGIRDTQCGAKVMRRAAVEAIHPQLRIADLAFDVNLLYALRRAGKSVREVPTVWTDQSGSKVAFNAKTSLNMLFSLVRLRLIYSPVYPWLGPLRPLEAWLYRKLNAPQPLSASEARRQDPAELRHG
ncbi:MAG: glycosyltransferase [Verrucomicrobia bacterium]|nr:MAG: glycosyltransferase [Verrucomicrobiota bacterium]